MNSGQILRNIIYERGIRLNWIADKLGIEYDTFTARLRKPISIELLFDICKLIDYDVQDYLNIYRQKNELSPTPAKMTDLTHQTQLDS